MKKYLMLLSLLLPVSSFAYNIEKEVTGEGASKERAIQSGLKEAVRQHFGVEVRSTSVSHLEESNEDINDQFKSSELQAFKGFVESYDILDINNNGSDYQVTLNVVLNVDEKNEAKEKLEHRKTIAFSFNGKNASRFKSSSEAYFVGARKFAVVQNKSDARYLLDVDVKKSYSYTKKSTKYIKLTGESKTTYKTDSMFEIQYKVVDQLTGQIVSSDIQKTTSSKKNLDLLITKYATEKLYKAISEAVAPVRVVGFTDELIMMGEGGKNIKEGDVYDVFSLGEEIIDPYTGESLGNTETKIATVKVVDVLPKMSKAKLLSGKKENIKQYDIMRKSKVHKKFKTKEAAPVKTVEEDSNIGGIVL